MKKEILEKYIQLAIDNGYNGWNDKIEYISAWNTMVKLIDKIGWTKVYDILELITSKLFIEAVANWILKTITSWEFKRLLNLPEYTYKSADDKQFLFWEYFSWDSTVDYKVLIAYITCNQAIAIRDRKLEEFINNLLNLWKIQ